MGVSYETGTVYPSRAPEFTPVFGEVWVVHLFSFLHCLCLRRTSCVPNVTGFSNLSIIVSVFALRLVCLMLPGSLDCPFYLRFLSNVY